MTVIARETRRDRLVVADEAGMHRLSFVSVLAGTLVAYGAFAVLAAVTGAILEATNTDADISNFDWETAGAVGAAAVGVALFLSYLFGGYVAGRMARRAGVLHGVGVLVLGIIAGALIGLAVAEFADTDALAEDLRNIGIPTTANEWESVGTVAGIVSLLAIAAGALLGGMLGDRWHSKLTARAADPEIGATADRRRELAERDEELDLRDRDRDGDVDRRDRVIADRERDVDDDGDPDRTVVTDYDRTDTGRPDATQRDRDPGIVTGR